MNSSSLSVRSLLQRLGSMSLAIILLMVLAIASVIGTVLQQNQEQTDYLQQFGPLWFQVFRVLGLFDMYHSLWFQSLLGFLMLSLTVCLWRNVPRILKELRSLKVPISDRAFGHLQLIHQWSAQGTVAQWQATITKLLRGWSVAPEQAGERYYLRADRGRYRKSGYILVHGGLLVLLIGGLMTATLGFRGNMNVTEGSANDTFFFLQGLTMASEKVPFQVRCNSFFIDYYPTGMPKEFRSNLTIIDGGKEALTTDIIVNEPLYYKGVRIYQSSFGDGGSQVKLKLHRFGGKSGDKSGGKPSEEITSHIYETWHDSYSDATLEFTNFRQFNIENMAEAGKKKELTDLGPSVEYIIRGKGLKSVKVKAFMNPIISNGEDQGSLMLVSLTGDERDYEPYYLGLDLTKESDLALFNTFRAKIAAAGSDKENVKLFKEAVAEVFGDKTPPDLQITGYRVLQAMQALAQLPWPWLPMMVDYEQHYYTGLQLTQDPGMNVVWIGSALVVVGMFIMFYMPHRKLWLIIEPASDGRLNLRLGGMTNSNRLGFEREFHLLLGKLGESAAPHSANKGVHG